MKVAGKKEVDAFGKSAIVSPSRRLGAVFFRHQFNSVTNESNKDERGDHATWMTGNKIEV